jgi:hypothetical protein
VTLGSKQTIQAAGSKRLKVVGRLAAMFVLLGGIYLALLALLNQIDTSGAFILAGGVTFALSVFALVYVIKPQGSQAFKKQQAEKDANPSFRPVAAD